MARYSKRDILNKSWETFAGMTKAQLLKYAKSASQLAKERRTKLIKGLVEKNLPLPPSLQRWSTTQVFPDKFNQESAKLSQVTGYNNYDRGYGNIDFSVNEGMSKNDLLHKINVARRFLSNETSTVGGWEKYYNSIVKRISQKSGMKLTPEQYPMFWDLYNRVKEMMRGSSQFASRFDYGKSGDTQKEIARYMIDKGFTVDKADELARLLDTHFREEYEEEVDEDDDDGFWI